MYLAYTLKAYIDTIGGRKSVCFFLLVTELSMAKSEYITRIVFSSLKLKVIGWNVTGYISPDWVAYSFTKYLPPKQSALL